MKTLSKNITKLFFKEEYQDNYYQLTKELWKELLDSGQRLEFSHHLLYAILRGKDWRKCYTPVTNSIKIENGQTPGSSLRRAIYDLTEGRAPYNTNPYLIFEKYITSDCRVLVRELLVDYKNEPYCTAGLLVESK